MLNTSEEVMRTIRYHKKGFVSFEKLLDINFDNLGKDKPINWNTYEQLFKQIANERDSIIKIHYLTKRIKGENEARKFYLEVKPDINKIVVFLNKITEIREIDINFK